MGKFQLFGGNNGYYFRLKASNGETILSSESYSSKQGSQNGVQSVKANSPYDSKYEKKTSTSGYSYFVLKGGNGEIIGTSEMYSSSIARDNGIAAVKREAPTATIEDLT